MPLRTVIVGGGIAGLSLARELALRGLDATVLERAPKLATVGAGIIMNPNAMVDDLEVAEARAASAGATPQPPPKVDLSRMGGRIFFETKLQLAGVKFDLSSEGWATTPAEVRAHEQPPR